MVGPWRPGDPLEDMPDDDNLIGRRRMVAASALVAGQAVFPMNPQVAIRGGHQRGFTVPSNDLLSIASILAEIRDILLSEIPQGVVVPLTIAVSSTQFSAPISFGSRLFALTIINDGTGSVLIRLPFKNTPTFQVNAGESFPFTFQTGVVGDIGVACVNATAASVRLVGYI